MSKIIPFILAGGYGSRLWPVSRRSFPKQFVRLFDNKTSMYQDTLERLAIPDFLDFPRVIVNQAHAGVAYKQARALGMAPVIYAEPLKKNTCASVALAALAAYEEDKDAIVLISPSDHVVGDTDPFEPEGLPFVSSLHLAARVAQVGLISLIGVKPHEPSASYGYIQPNRAVPISVPYDSSCIPGTAFPVELFHEKPTIELAREYLDQGFLWNSGYFIFRADIMLVELETYVPDLLSKVKDSFENRQITPLWNQLGYEGFVYIESQPIDRAVIEKSKRTAVIESNFHWNDMGDWRGVWRERVSSAPSSQGNLLHGLTLVTDCKRNAIYNESGLLVAAHGVDNLAIVVTEDCVLVTPLNRSSEVDDVVKSVKEMEAGLLKEIPGLDGEDYVPTLYDEVVIKPWGFYHVLDRGKEYLVKRLSVKPNHRLSLQSHKHREEFWTIIKGHARITLGEQIQELRDSGMVSIMPEQLHRLENIGHGDLEIIEVQRGYILDEDDIYRYSDDYGRDAAVEKADA